MNINKNDTAVVVIDPQNDVLSEKGVSWDLVGESVKDATAAPRHPKLGDGYKAALINFGYIANVVLSTDEVVAAMQ
ncbi:MULTISPECIES: hypothetical protein [unclassified Nostoc]|uniref:hypothetical protein n=1 Tax=unclassified Nostoc TaxID=2593658 RepID=UPI001D3DE9A9|nr:hypothetical protein [Nostoc sp. JL23]MBN3879953.1 hypothetical protein [Nostoc sp. JL23]